MGRTASFCPLILVLISDSTDGTPHLFATFQNLYRLEGCASSEETFHLFSNSSMQCKQPLAISSALQHGANFHVFGATYGAFEFDWQRQGE